METENARLQRKIDLSRISIQRRNIAFLALGAAVVFSLQSKAKKHSINRRVTWATPRS